METQNFGIRKNAKIMWNNEIIGGAKKGKEGKINEYKC